MCPVHGHMVYFVSNRVYVLVRSLETNVLPGLSTCVSVLAGGQQSTLEVEHYLIGRSAMYKTLGLSPG